MRFKKLCAKYDAQKHWLKIEAKKLSGSELKSELQKYRTSATSAYNEYRKITNSSAT